MVTVVNFMPNATPAGSSFLGIITSCAMLGLYIFFQGIEHGAYISQILSHTLNLIRLRHLIPVLRRISLCEIFCFHRFLINHFHHERIARAIPAQSVGITTRDPGEICTCPLFMSDRSLSIFGQVLVSPW